MCGKTTLLVWALLLHSGLSISLDQLFPYGLQFGDSPLLQGEGMDDATSTEVHLNVPLNFFQREYLSLFVNENGLVSFLTEISTFYSVQFPMDYPVIAPFYADIDTRGGGQVYWRASDQAEDLSRAANLVSRYYEASRDFVPGEVVVVTWDTVGYFDMNTDKTNMFQLIVASNEEETYTVFLFPESGVEWVRGSGKNSNQPDPQAQAGFMSGEGQSYLLPLSGLDQMINIDNWSNTNVPGLWIFKVGPLAPLENVTPPDTGVSQISDPREAESCQAGRAMCHSRAICSDNQFGFCCQCKRGWYGDGENCLEEKQPQRVNGRVNGELNGESIIGQDLNCYVVTEDGRTYTAISRLSGHLGWQLQAAVPLGTVISWLFAKPRQGGQNGFSLTGGVLNYTAEVVYPETGDRLSIVFEFKGLDVFDHLIADVNFIGTIPTLPQGTKIRVDDYHQQFSRAGPGFISSKTEHLYSIEGTNEIVTFSVDQAVRWNECSGSEGLFTTRATSGTMRLESARNFIIYDQAEQIVRFAMTSSISPLASSEDPCTGVECGQAGLCLVTGDTHTCSCLPGFGLAADTGLCADIDECSEPEQSGCHQEAECLNTPGSFTCSCREGFTGDGAHCVEEKTCKELACSENADCVTDLAGQGRCVCRRGFKGDGDNCFIIPSDVTLRGYGDPETSAVKTIKAVNNIEAQSDLGPEVSHYYEVSNFGPFDVGKVFINVSWPLKTKDQGWLLYLTEIPSIKYSSLGKEMEEECDIDPSLINSLSLENLRKSRSTDNQDYGFGTGAIFDTGEEFEEYDYTQLENEFLSTEKKKEENKLGSGSSNFMTGGLPEAEKVMFGNPEAPVYEGTHYSSVSFICRMSLAVNEVALIKIPSRLVYSTLSSGYKSSVSYSLVSSAQMLETDLVVARDNSTVSVLTRLQVLEPELELSPGRGVSCGALECHKYASCHVTWAEQELTTCKCPPGFSGDGVQSCEPAEEAVTEAAQAAGADCRVLGCGARAECQYQASSDMFTCQCSPGYKGDGSHCTEDTEARYPSYTSFTSQRPLVTSTAPRVSGGRYQCRGKEDCHQLASCVYERETRRYQCQCDKWYQGDGWSSCQPAPNAGCNILDNCHPSARCVYSEANDEFFCRCEAGYLGDGYDTCDEEPKIGCNVINNCGRFARCLFNPADRGYDCHCDTVRGFTGDGYNCTPSVSCFENPAICDPNADCIPTRDHQSKCRCKPLFLGDGLECKPAPKFEGNFMLVAQGMMIFKVPFNGKGSKPINILSSQVASGIDIDCMKGHVYWTDTTNRQIKRSDISGKNPETFLADGLQFPEGIAIDWVSRNVYWTDPGQDTVEVANMDHGTRATLLEGDLESPRGIAVHPGVGRMFWTDWDRLGPKIEAANMDGTERMTLVGRDLGEPNCLAVDPWMYEVCWADSGSSALGIKARIDCIGVNGGGRRTIIELPNGETPYGITITENNIFWTDWQKKQVQSVDKLSGSRQPSIPYALSHLGKPYDLVNVPEECPNLSNTCQGEPCGPGRLCLPDGKGSHTCK